MVGDGKTAVVRAGSYTQDLQAFNGIRRQEVEISRVSNIRHLCKVLTLGSRMKTKPSILKRVGCTSFIYIF